MSKLTHAILDGTDYEFIKRKRQENFVYAAELFGTVNKINPLMFFDNECVPMVYPLVVEDDSLLERLQKAKHFQGHWWSYLCEEMPEKSFEYWILRFVIPMTIDQRYGKEEIKMLRSIL